MPDKRKKNHFSTKHLVTIAILASLGGALSTYIGYLGNLINRFVGVPFGAGQFLAGLHIIWILLAIGLTQKKGAGTITGILKGIIELFLGSTHGIVILLVSAVQGILADTVLFSDRVKRRRGLVPYSTAGAVSAASNVFVFYVFYLAGVPVIFMAVLCMLAAGSGIVFGGWAALQILQSLEFAGVIEPQEDSTGKSLPERRSASKGSKKVVYASMIITVAFLAVFTMGAVYYFSSVYESPDKEGIEVTGNVESGFTFTYEDFQDEEITINAELIGSVTYEPPRNYTGIPLHEIITKASVKNSASDVIVIANDGYSMEFKLDEIMNDREVIITRESDSYRLIAANYDGSYWVRNVIKLEIK